MQAHSYSFEALGTNWEIVTKNELGTDLKDQIVKRIDLFDSTYSRFRSDSLVSHMKEKAGRYEFPDDARELFSFYRTLYDTTSGKVTPLIGEMLERAGYDAHYSLVPKAQTKLPKWDEVMTIKGNIIETLQPITLDVGAAGKGYLVDIISRLLNDEGINDFVIDASGDLIYRGADVERIGLEHPMQKGIVIGVAMLQNQSLCASATNRRAWGEGMHHIFDPDTKQPTDDVIASWVVSDSTMLADGLATALFFGDPKELARTFDFSYVRMHSDESIDYSRNFNGELFLDD